YLIDFVLDSDLEEPVSKNSRFISPTDSPAIIEQFQDAKDNVAKNSESSESSDKSLPPDNEMDENMKLMKGMLDSLAVNIESINKQQEEMQKQMDTVTDKIDTITTSQPPTTITDGTTTNSSRAITTTTTNQNVAATYNINFQMS
uniref:Uncharacterized protein n=1 Tax=Megaselia scalaris TaxID=36166 RepID=T1H0P4_MEGSC